MKTSLNRILNNAGFGAAPVKAFTDWPMLELVALRFIYFVSPWLIVEGENLAERTLREAITKYDETLPLGYDASYRKFIERIAASARVLASLRVSVKNRDGLWVVWSYDEPLMDHLANHQRNSIQIRRRETPVTIGAVMIKLLASISPTQELEVAGLDYSRLLDASSA